ncbi:hypothetical protein [Saccharopolyspora spinosa]|uniref:hypothetical protein n=1 Tax=Saccharopolyspora spinosa TaxID=60894 RepID=UPI0002F1709B
MEIATSDVAKSVDPALNGQSGQVFATCAHQRHGRRLAEGLTTDPRFPLKSDLRFQWKSRTTGKGRHARPFSACARA